MLSSVLKKEFLLIKRDVHALAVLFIMPTAFILIMSLSLQDKFRTQETEKLGLALEFENHADLEHPLGRLLLDIEGFDVHHLSSSDDDTLKDLFDDGTLSAQLKVPREFISRLESQQEIRSEDQITLLFSPTLPSYFRELTELSVLQLLSSYQVMGFVEIQIADEQQKQEINEKLLATTLISTGEIFNTRQRQPNSVEQTVPAWLIFAMFFVVIPLSTTFLNERQQGTLLRLRTSPAPSHHFFVGKLLPYLGINLIQTVLMFLVGIFLVPVLGGDGISLQSNAWLLLPMSCAVSFAAISFALLVASASKTTEQATTIGGVSNLILAAIGGVMVPTFAMPDLMQQVAKCSPMHWGLEGYLSILLRDASLQEILPEIGKLMSLGIVLFTLAIFTHKRADVQ